MSVSPVAVNVRWVRAPQSVTAITWVCLSCHADAEMRAFPRDYSHGVRCAPAQRFRRDPRTFRPCEFRDGDTG